MAVDEYIEDAIETLHRLLGVVRGVTSNMIRLETDIEFRIKQLDNLNYPTKIEKPSKRMDIRGFLEKNGYPESEIVRLLNSTHLFYFLGENVK